MSGKKIFITTNDREKLLDLITAGLDTPEAGKEYLRRLKTELDRAEVVSPENVPSDVVTMNTRVKFRDLDSQEIFSYRIVYPSRANPERKKVSVLAPIGTALLGCRVNDVVEWPVPAGIRRLKIEEVLYQPEANGAFHL